MARARAAERSGRLDEARQVLRGALRGAEGAAAVELRLALVRLLLLGGHELLAEADELLDLARRQAERLSSPRQLAIALHLSALLERRRGQTAKARELLDASPILHAAPRSPEAAQLFHFRGLLALDAGDLDTAAHDYCQAHQLYRELGVKAGMAEVGDSLAGLLLKQGKAGAALKFSRQSLELKRVQGDRWGEAITLGTLGRIYLQQSRWSEARSAFAADLALARELGDRRGIGIMLNSLGEVAGLEGRLDESLRYYRQSITEDPSPVNEAFARIGLARFLVAERKLDEAGREAEGAAAILARHAHPPSLDAALLGVQGALAGRRGDVAAGLGRLSEAVARFEQLHEPLDTIPLLYEIRDLEQQRGNLAGAVAAMSRALDLLSACGAVRAVRDVEQWLRRVDHPGLTRLALERHLPAHLVHQVLAGELNLPAPQRQEVSVLFNDICGFTPLAEGLEPEQVVELLNEWFSEATVAIRRHGGVVDKFIGDAVMAVFGVPQPRPDAAADAVRAAVDMRAALAALNARQQALGEPQFRTTTGIATGEAVVGFLGSHLRQSYTVIGDTVNTAARLETAAKRLPGCDILICPRTEQQQRKFSATETVFVGPLELKGKQRPVSVYRVS